MELKHQVIIYYMQRGLYYRRYGELIGASTEPIKYALEKYEDIVEKKYEYKEDFRFNVNGEKIDSDRYYALHESNPEKYPLYINDYIYVTSVFKDLKLLSKVYTTYDSFIYGLILDRTSEDVNNRKFKIVDNRGTNGIEKTITSYDDLLPGDMVIVQEGEKKSIKIYAGRRNWIEMDSETLEDLKDDGKRKNDRYSWCLNAPIANYKGRGSDLDRLYGQPIDINNVLWVFRNEELSNNYIFNDSAEYTDWQINNFRLNRKSSTDPTKAYIIKGHLKVE